MGRSMFEWLKFTYPGDKSWDQMYPHFQQIKISISYSYGYGGLDATFSYFVENIFKDPNYKSFEDQELPGAYFPKNDIVRLIRPQ